MTASKEEELAAIRRELKESAVAARWQVWKRLIRQILRTMKCCSKKGWAWIRLMRWRLWFCFKDILDYKLKI